ncbi:type II toxin-antitoxin system RelE/ParE family toxin [Desulfamplus magnetovallimortis]|uniref:type II toxin-antitoxin system RelE/ParE family toxin n=1 Tax=Desulfamplus magnetovallimortis TaxID=1246637 RepID=UPI0009BC59F0
MGNGIHEIKIDYDPGYRIYFANHGDVIIVLLCSGDKRTQDKDIKIAHEYWKTYKKEYR